MEIIRHNLFDDFSNIRYGFFTKNGGVSEGVFESLNIGLNKGDDPNNTRKNRALILEKFPNAKTKDLVTPCQVHGDGVIILEEDGDIEPFHNVDYYQKPNVDAVVTALKHIPIGISTADCAPILFVDEKNSVIGAAHAGWKGAKLGIIEKTVGAMVKIGAKRNQIKAIVGPHISQDSYEVDSKFRDEFLKDSQNNDRFFIASVNTGYFMFDLGGFISLRLGEAGVGKYLDINVDTYKNRDRFFSYRRNCHGGNYESYGSQFSGVMLI